METALIFPAKLRPTRPDPSKTLESNLTYVSNAAELNDTMYIIKLLMDISIYRI